MEYFDAPGGEHDLALVRRRQREDSCASMGISLDGSGGGRRAYSPPPRRAPVPPPDPEALDHLRCMPSGATDALATAIARQRPPRCMVDGYKTRYAGEDSGDDADPDSEEPRRANAFDTTRARSRSRSRSRERAHPAYRVGTPQPRGRQDAAAPPISACALCTRTDRTMREATCFIVTACIEKFLALDTICIDTAELIRTRDAEAASSAPPVTPGDVAVHIRVHMAHPAVGMFVVITDNLPILANLVATSAKHVTSSGAVVYDEATLKQMREQSLLMTRLYRTRPSDCAATELPPVETSDAVTAFARRLH